LRSQSVAEDRIHEWMQRYQERALDAAMLADGAASIRSDLLSSTTSP
jgi:hypothetical protein